MFNKLLLPLFILTISSVSFAKETPGPRNLTVKQCFAIQKTLLTGIIPTDAKAREALQGRAISVHNELRGLDYAGVLAWTEKKITGIKRDMALAQMRFMAKKPPAFDKTQKLGEARVNIDELHFSQLNIGSKTGSNNEYTVFGNARAIKEGKLDVKIFPKLRVWRDVNGKIWTLDHRRLAAMRLSGVIDEVDVVFVPEWRVNLERFKFSTESDGKMILMRFKDKEDPTKEVVAVIVNDGKRLQKPKD